MIVCVAGELSVSMELLSLLILVENFRQETTMEKLLEILQKGISDAREVAEESRATGLCHMIGNVAHDLKTVSPTL